MKPIVIITLQNGIVRHLAASGSLDVYVHDLDCGKGGFDTAPQEVDVETIAEMQQRVTNAGLEIISSRHSKNLEVALPPLP